MFRSTMKVFLTVGALAGLVLVATRSPSTAERAWTDEAVARAGVAHQAVGWETAIRELSVGP